MYMQVQLYITLHSIKSQWQQTYLLNRYNNQMAYFMWSRGIKGKKNIVMHIDTEESERVLNSTYLNLSCLKCPFEIDLPFYMLLAMTDKK